MRSTTVFDWFGRPTDTSASETMFLASEVVIDRCQGSSAFTAQILRCHDGSLGEWTLTGHVEVCQIRQPRMVPVKFTALVDGQLQQLAGVGHVVSMSGRQHGTGYHLQITGEYLRITREITNG